MLGQGVSVDEVLTDFPDLERDDIRATQYTADDFLKQIEFWGIDTSFAFVTEPQANGVAESFNRTLKEQAIHGRIFRNVEDVRAAVTEFEDRYNRHWRLGKLGFMSPLEVRQPYAIRKVA